MEREREETHTGGEERTGGGRSAHMHERRANDRLEPSTNLFFQGNALQI